MESVTCHSSRTDRPSPCLAAPCPAAARSPSARSHWSCWARRSCRTATRRRPSRPAPSPGCRSPTPPQARAPSRRPCARRSTRSSPRVVRRRARRPAPASGRRPWSQPGALRRLRGPALLPPRRLDRLHRGRGGHRAGRQRDLRERAIGVPRGDRRPVADRAAPPAAALGPAARARAERAELTEAARSVAKVWVLRHEIQGVPLPDGFLARHPEARATGDRAGHHGAALRLPTTSVDHDAHRRQPVKTIARLPGKGPGPRTPRGRRADPHLLVRPDLDADDRVGLEGRGPQPGLLGDKLGTTSSGTAITDMVRVTNGNTGWDLPSHAGQVRRPRRR